MSRASTQDMLRKLPASWALGLLLLLVAYWLAQPLLNSRLGWHLPSVAGLLGEREPHAAQRQRPQTETESATKSSADRSAADSPAQPTDNQSTAQPPPPATNKSAASQKSPESDQATELLYGLLKETGRQRYVSPEGLQYNPGSEEGHRLKHLERHLKDMPDRPGKHGVFDGDMPQVLKWIDDAYSRGKRGAKGVRKQAEDGRTVYEVPFSQPIGYVGGRDGKRDNHPPARKMRLVVDGNRFITAFPF